jgi:hypothetical protein
MDEYVTPAPQPGEPSLLPPTPPSQYAPGFSTQAPGRRPVAATVIAIVLLVFAAMNLLAFLPNKQSALDMRILSWSTAVLFIAGQVSVAIGLLQLRRWSRKATIFVMIGKFVLEHALTVYVLLQSFGEMQRIMSSTPGMPPSLLNFSLIAGMVFSVVFWGVVYGLMIFFLTRPNVVEAFDRQVVE